MKQKIYFALVISGLLQASEDKQVIQLERDALKVSNYAIVEFIGIWPIIGQLMPEQQCPADSSATLLNIGLKGAAMFTVGLSAQNRKSPLIGQPVQRLHKVNRDIAVELGKVMVGVPCVAALACAAVASLQEEPSHELHEAVKTHATFAAYNGATILATYLYETLRISVLG